jgi:glutamate racemase
MDERPIGFFDSGVGGLSIWRAARRLLPREDLIFLADSGHAPYGDRPPGDVVALAVRNVEFLLGLDAKLIVVACNTASVHALGPLRERYPDVPFVGVVPVVKTLARYTRTGVIGILATPATARSAYLASLIAAFAPDKRVVRVGCHGLADLIEAGQLRSARMDALLERYVAPLRRAGVDAVGLGCTHYPLVRRRIKRMLGPEVRVFEPSRPVARRVRQVLFERDALTARSAGRYRFYTTGDPGRFRRVAQTVMRLPVIEVGRVDL